MWETLNQYLLLLTVTSPLAGLVALAVISRSGSNVMALREAVVVHVLLTLGLSVLLVIQYRVPLIESQMTAEAHDNPAVQMQGGFRWIGDPTRSEERRTLNQKPDDERAVFHSQLPIVRMAWGIDGVRLCFIVMTALVMIPAVLSPVYGRRRSSNSSAAVLSHHSDVAVNLVCLLGCSFGLLGLLAAEDIVWLIVCMGMLIGFSACLLGKYGGIDRREVMKRCITHLGVGTLAFGLAMAGMSYAFSWMQVWGGDAAFLPEFLWSRLQHDLVSLRYVDPVADQVWRQSMPAIGLMFLISAWAWLPMFPFHRRGVFLWQQSPPGLQLVWLCIGSQLGLFGLVQFVLPVFGPLEEATIWWSGLLGLVGFLYSQGVMAKQNSFLAAISYGVVAQQGLCFAALICGERSAFWGGLLQIVNVSLSVSLLIWHRMQSDSATKILSSWCYRVALGSLGGVPGTLGFAAQLLILWGLFSSPLAGEIVLLTLLGMIFGGRVWQRAMRLPGNEKSQQQSMTSTGDEPKPSIDRWTAQAYAIIVAGVLILGGVQPALILHRLRPSTEHLALTGETVGASNRTDATRPAHQKVSTSVTAWQDRNP